MKLLEKPFEVEIRKKCKRGVQRMPDAQFERLTNEKIEDWERKKGLPSADISKLKGNISSLTVKLKNRKNL